MRLAWAIALGVAVAAVLAWWLGREQAAETMPGAAPTTSPSVAPEASRRVLYRWRDDAGVVQVTDTPPSGRKYETVDVDALDRRNKFDAKPAPRDP